jgi:hypothetical protein
MPVNFNNEMLTVIDEGAASFEEVISFTSVPAAPLNMVTQYVAMADTVPYGTGPAIYPDYDVEYMKYDMLDLSYDAGSTSATAATDGGPIGDRRWMEYDPTGIQESARELSEGISVYPNPMGSNATVKFLLEESSQVSVTIYNMLGAKVYEVGGKQYGPGWNEMTLDRGGLEAGIYFLQLSRDHESDLIKISVQ